MVIPLQEVIEKDSPAYTEFIERKMSGFICRDKDVESFLKNTAFDYERRNKSRTYLIFDDAGKDALLGYYTLSLKSLEFSESVSKTAIKNIDGYTNKVKSVGIVLIGQFGKDEVLAKDVAGKLLFEKCIKTVYNAQRIVGGRFVMLECLDIDKIVSFYGDAAFEFKRFQQSENGKYLQLIKKL
jgi:hypothetical protein